MPHAMFRPISICVVACLLLSLCGCVQRKDTITLNPDGSGKAIVDITLDKPPMPVTAETGELPNPALTAKNAARSIVKSSKGVAAWKDVTFGALPDGRCHFAGTAYFPDISRFELQNAGKIDVNWTKTGDGTMVLSFKAPEKPAIKNAAALSDEEVEARIDTTQQNWIKSLPIVTAMLRNLRIQATYVLPGKVEKAAIFKRVENGVSLTIEGEAVLAGMTRIMEDREGMKRAIKAGRDAGQTESEEALMEKLFGAKARAEVRVSGVTAPLFDYAAESAAAKKAQPEMIKTLGIE